MLLFREKSITVRASPAEVTTAIRYLPEKDIKLLNDNTFTFYMWEKRVGGRMYSPIRFSGTIEKRGKECILTYFVRPGIVISAMILALSCFFLYTAVRLLFMPGSLYFLAASAAFPLFMLLIVLPQVTTCDERLMRKLRELEKQEK